VWITEGARQLGRYFLWEMAGGKRTDEN
jgi:hypothetical protein